MSACDILVIANLNMDLILEQKNSQQTSRKRYADSFTRGWALRWRWPA